jgi:hypothetical protein
LVGVDGITERGGILLAALVVILDGVVVEENLESVTVVVHHDGAIGTLEGTLKRDALLVTPPIVQEAVEDDCILSTTEANVEENVVAVETVEGGVVNGVLAGRGGVQVELCRLPNDDTVSFELALERDLVSEVAEIEHGDSAFFSPKSVRGKVCKVRDGSLVCAGRETNLWMRRDRGFPDPLLYRRGSTNVLPKFPLSPP